MLLLALYASFVVTIATQDHDVSAAFPAPCSLAASARAVLVSMHGRPDRTDPCADGKDLALQSLTILS